MKRVWGSVGGIRFSSGNAKGLVEDRSEQVVCSRALNDRNGRRRIMFYTEREDKGLP